MESISRATGSSGLAVAVGLRAVLGSLAVDGVAIPRGRAAALSRQEYALVARTLTVCVGGALAKARSGIAFGGHRYEGNRDRALGTV